MLNSLGIVPVKEGMGGGKKTSSTTWISANNTQREGCVNKRKTYEVHDTESDHLSGEEDEEIGEGERGDLLGANNT